MKTSENGAAQLQELTLAEMKKINGGQWITVIIGGERVRINL